MSNEKERYLKEAAYIGDGWVGDNFAYYLRQNARGEYWPSYIVKANYGGWCPIIIRDTSPFKTLNGAIKFIETYRARYQ